MMCTDKHTNIAHIQTCLLSEITAPSAFYIIMDTYNKILIPVWKRRVSEEDTTGHKQTRKVKEEWRQVQERRRREGADEMYILSIYLSVWWRWTNKDKHERPKRANQSSKELTLFPTVLNISVIQSVSSQLDKKSEHFVSDHRRQFGA